MRTYKTKVIEIPGKRITKIYMKKSDGSWQFMPRSIFPRLYENTQAGA